MTVIFMLAVVTVPMKMRTTLANDYVGTSVVKGKAILALDQHGEMPKRNVALQDHAQKGKVALRANAMGQRAFPKKGCALKASKVQLGCWYPATQVADSKPPMLYSPC